MTYPPVTSNTQQTPQPPTARRSPAAWIVGGLALVVVLGVIAAVVIAAGQGQNDPGPDAPQAAPVSVPAATLSVRGSIKLGLGDFVWSDGTGQGITGPTCAGDGGYDDIATGASVTVTDASGVVVALGKIDSSNPTGFSEAKTPTACKLNFAVPGVPAGKGFYGVEVSHRGAVKFEESKLAAPVELALG